MKKFIEALAPSTVDAFCAAMMTGQETRKTYRDPSQSTAPAPRNLQEFLDNNGEAKSAARQSVLYKVDTQLLKTKKGYNYFEVAQFIRDGFGRPYIPGSTIKGLLRTALLVSVLSANPKPYHDAIERTQDLKKEASRIENNVLFIETLNPERPDDKSDVMRFISVSDSEPLSVSDLCFAKKYDRFSKKDEASHKRRMGNSPGGDYREGNDLNLYRECLKPGTTIVFSVAIDSRIEQHLPSIRFDAEGLEKLFSDSYALYKRCFIDRFKQEEEVGGQGSQPIGDSKCKYVSPPDSRFPGRKCTNTAVFNGYCNLHKAYAASETAGAKAGGGSYCVVGGGTDYDSKTIINALYPDDSERVNRIAHILFGQFQSQVDPSTQMLSSLVREIRAAGFNPDTSFSTQKRADGKVIRAKNDHRHWKDPALGVSPHTMKYGMIGKAKFPMGKCKVIIQEEDR